jgi:hypothetical protein
MRPIPVSLALFTHAPDKQDQTAEANSKHKAHYEVRHVGGYAGAVQDPLEHETKRGNCGTRDKEKSIIEFLSQQHCLVPR